MSYATQINPPIIFQEASGTPTELRSVEEVIEFVGRRANREDLETLREAAFIAAAVPSAENIETLRNLAAEALG